MADNKLPSGIDRVVGQRIRWRRKELKLTQEKIEPGQLLAMYSDGLTEATENGELVGIDAFGEKLGGMYSGDGESCGELAERLSAWLDTLLEGGVPNDDRTFLLARRM